MRILGQRIVAAVVLGCFTATIVRPAMAGAPARSVSSERLTATAEFGMILADAQDHASDAQDGAPGSSAVEREPYRNPELTALRSLIIPGWGQHYTHQSGKGWLMFVLAAVGWLLALEVVSTGLLQGASDDNDLERGLGVFTLVITYTWTVADAYISAKRLNRENGYDFAVLPPESGARVALLQLGF